MLRIVVAPNPVLSAKAKPIETFDQALLSFIEELKVALANTRDPEGVGLAAPQVGKSVQVFISKPTPKSKVEVFINPVVTLLTTAKKEGSKKSGIKLEGCLSLPTIWGEVARAESVHVAYCDEYGKKHEKTLKGFPAVIVQHEYDHLHGTLFPKRVLEQKGKLYKSRKDADGQDVFEQLEM